MRVGRWLDTEAQVEHEDRILTGKLVPFVRMTNNGEGCLGGVAFGEVDLPGYFYQSAVAHRFWFGHDADDFPHTYVRFNLLCQKLAGIPLRLRNPIGSFDAGPFSVERLRLGGARAGVLIRNRILRNRLKRIPAPATCECVTSDSDRG